MAAGILRYVSLWGFVLSALPAWAQAPPRPMLDLLPASEFGGFLIRDVADLERRGDELIDAVGVPMHYRPSECVSIAVKWLGVEQSYDRRQPIGVLLAGHDRESSDFEGIVMAVPFRDRTAMLKDVRLEAEPGVIGEVQPGKQLGSDFWMCGATDERYLFLGGGRDREISRASVQSQLSDPRLSTAASAGAQSRLNDVDLLLHVGAGEILRRDRGASEREFWRVDPAGLDPDEQVVAAEFSQAARELEHVYFSLRLDDGLEAHHRLQFRTGEGTTAGKLLRELRAEASTHTVSPSLRGLPAGPVLAAGTMRLPQARQQLLARTILRLLSQQASGSGAGWVAAWEGGAFTDVRQAVLLGALVEVLPLTTELRFAAYPNSDQTTAIIVVLEAEQPDRVVAALHELSDLLVAGAAEEATVGAAIEPLTDAGLRKLVRELAAEDFAVRSRATTRLLLLGERARPTLEQAAAADDAEVAARARSLLGKLTASVAQREHRLLEDNPLVGAHPQLAYHVAAESAAGRRVDMIQLTLPTAEAAREKQLVDLFGPEWNRVRITTTARSVVLAFGTPGPRWEEVLANLDRGGAGLAHDPRLVRLPDDPERLLELHFPLSRLVKENEYRSWNNGPPRDTSPSRGLSAVGYSASETELVLDLHLPVDELRGVVVKRGWSW